MAEELQDQDKANGASAMAGEQQPSKLPKGVVLDKDGKPCRTCTSSADWKEMMKNTPLRKKPLPKTAPPPTTIESRNDCPPDVEALGRSTWTLLHTMAATYPDVPSRGQQTDLVSFVKLFSRLYPCWVCAEDFQGYVAREPPRVASRDDFGTWLCGAHNEVNRKLGKPVFDCSKWEERWRTGWKDGRCD